MPSSKSKDELKETKDGDEPDEGEEKESRTMCIVIVVMVALLLLATLDSFTTRYFKSLCAALAAWTMQNAPGSFVVYELVIFAFLCCCLPYGPLGVLSGALFYQKYGTFGIFLAGTALFLTTLAGSCVCFMLARYKLKDTVKKQIDNSPKLNFLKSLDRLMDDGQGIEMVVLIRLAPLPKGPTNYFLGTTTVSFRDFFIGTCIVNLPMSFVDVSIGAGANNVKKDSPLSVGIFVLAVTCFLSLICYVGGRAKKKLMALDAEDADAAASNELDGLKNGDDDTFGEGGGPAGALEDGTVQDEDWELLHSPDKDGSSSKASSKGSSRKKEATSTNESASLLDKLDGLQLIGKPNAWKYPDPRLNMLANQSLSTPDSRVCSLMVQLSSQTFSFQLLSSRLGWPVRVFPRDAKPKAGVHASQKGLLLAEARDHCVAVAADGTVKNAPGHGHNFHVLEEIGDVVTIHCARSLKAEADVEDAVSHKSPSGASRESLADAQLSKVHYQVWYEVTRKGVLIKDAARDSAEGGSPERSTLKKRKHRKIEEFEAFEEAFVGGDGIDIDSRFNGSFKLSKEDVSK